jgi:hypothetical protein
MQTQMSCRFHLLVTQTTDRITNNPFLHEVVGRLNSPLNQQPGKEAMFAFCLGFPNSLSVESAVRATELKSIG